MLSFAAQNDIKNPAKYIDQVKDSLRNFRSLAAENGVAPLFRDIIQSRLAELLPDVFDRPDTASDLVRFEVTDSGNIHLYAKIDGQEKRKVFTKKNPQYESMLQTMKSPLTEEQQRKLLDLWMAAGVAFP